MQIVDESDPRSCEIGKGGSCMDDIRPLLTPRGLCFVVSSNMTVRRPGPETTLSLLLNLEVYEIIPGMVVDSGVILSIHDSSETLSEQFTSGIHLEAGKVVTIPINEVRKLSRYQQYCGRRAVGPFSPKQYSRAACHWVATMQEVEKACRCRPVHSPFNSQHFLQDDTLWPTKHRRLKPCTLSKEIECAQLNPVNSSLACPDDCEDVSYSTVVFGGRLVTSDLPSLLPGDWEDVKESKVAEFQVSYTKPVKAETTLLLFQSWLTPLCNFTSHLPCVLQYHVKKWTSAVLHIIALQVVFSLLQLSVLENRTSRSFGVKNMDAQTREKVLDLVLPFISELKVCVKKIHDNVDRAEEIASDCRKMFLQTYNVFLDAQTVYFLGQSDFPVVVDYIANITKVVAALRRFIYTNRVKVLDWHDHDIPLRVFESLYRDTGADNLEIHELMKLRKLMISDILDSITPLTAYYEGGLRARINVLRLLGIEPAQHSSLSVIEATSKCLQKLAADVPLLKKSAFIRGEWLSRIQRQVEIAQSYSATPQYDQVNLLHVKLYFAHFKQERIVQERSYNMFLLLAEIGGTIGLYVGATLLTVAETIVFFIEERTRKAIVKPAYL
ncbi:unnamed protein product [Heligmosomoides polygyrus]|uniref:Exocyst complex component 6 n=1 Tax=Heligmosomoides polygyrus TaxID=6339 RepID=A0A183FQH7_HELPZ|nr:unnamed protein product [Heligmosomoides polygyrus]